LKNVLVILDSNTKVHKTIDIIVVYIPETYGILLRRDWSALLNKYFSNDWSHLWIPYNGKQNQIRSDRDIYMTHVVTYLNDVNEPITFNHEILGNYNLDTFFGYFIVKISPHAKSFLQFEILYCTQIVEIECNIIGRKHNNPNV
jgi:hypothetical protein